jgi:hypothetical protein
MQIRIIAPFGLKPKGTTRWRAIPLARALAARGHTIRLVIPSWDNPADAGRAWRDGGADIVCVPFPTSLGKAGWSVLLARLLQEAARSAPDLIHIFKPVGFSGAAGWAALRLRRGARPLVWADADDYEAEWARVQGRSKWQQAVIKWQEQRVLSIVDGVTVASRALGGPATGLRTDAPLYLPNTSALSPAHAPEMPNCVVWYTRFLDFPPSGVADIWAKVVGLVPGVRLRVIGAGFRGEEQAFADAVAARGLKDTVTLCGWLEGDALAAELTGACVAMFPFDDTPINRYKCPARLADLTAASVPVVAHAVGECTGYIRDGETGLLLPPGSVSEFAQAVAHLLMDDAARARMRSAAQRHFAQHFTPDALAARLEQAYADALDKTQT